MHDRGYHIAGAALVGLGLMSGSALMWQTVQAGHAETLLFCGVLCVSGLILLCRRRSRSRELITRMEQAASAGDERFLQAHREDLREELGRLQDQAAEISLLQLRGRQVRDLCDLSSSTGGKNG